VEELGRGFAGVTHQPRDKKARGVSGGCQGRVGEKAVHVKKKEVKHWIRRKQELWNVWRYATRRNLNQPLNAKLRKRGKDEEAFGSEPTMGVRGAPLEVPKHSRGRNKETRLVSYWKMVTTIKGIK